MNAPMVWVALGSNLGDSQQILRAAARRFGRFAADRVRLSSFWQTDPVNCPPGSPRFINAVAGWCALDGETPESLLEKLRTLEVEFGRRPRLILNEPRPLDLDLIAFGNEIRATPHLTLPHPRAHERRFVLEPLSELAPDLVLPGRTATVAELLRDLPPDRSMRRLG